MRIEQASINLSKAKRADAITFLKGEAQDVLENLQGEYDFIFLDAAKAQYMNFLPELLRLLQKGGMLITDNVLQEGSIAVITSYSIHYTKLYESREAAEVTQEVKKLVSLGYKEIVLTGIHSYNFV